MGNISKKAIEEPALKLYRAEPSIAFYFFVILIKIQEIAGNIAFVL